MHGAPVMLPGVCQRRRIWRGCTVDASSRLPPDLLTQFAHLHPRAYRYAFGTASAHTEVPLDVVQSYLGHASPVIAAIYNTAGVRLRQREVAELLDR